MSKCQNAKMTECRLGYKNAHSAKSSKLSKTIVLPRLFHVDDRKFGFQ